MITYENPLLNTHKNLYYINAHKSVFDVEYFYPLDLFESFVEKALGWWVECGVKIQKDKLYPARFSSAFNNTTAQQYKAVLDFFHQVEARVEVKLDYHLLQQFLGNKFDFTRVHQISMGVDLRRELSASRLKFWVTMDNNYPEKLETAISLCGDSETLRLLLLNNPNNITVGFDFYLDGRSAIEVYPTITLEDLQNLDVQARLAQVLSPSVWNLFDGCWALMIGISEANADKVLYYRTRNPNNIIASLRNDTANRVHAYYQTQPFHGAIIGLQEREIVAGSIQNINLYYHMTNSS
ncbi:MAG TPA: hypothetical protein DCY88_31040 [Cyanobacteria bacterium UBA11372]|nr:hypothetical protein [Cyanobacteria bacterium UBA11372]